jgi:hypothetical protein
VAPANGETPTAGQATAPPPTLPTAAPPPTVQAVLPPPPTPMPPANTGPGGVVAPSSNPVANSGAAPLPAPKPQRARKIAAFVLGGVGVGSLAVGSVFGLRAFSKRADSDKHCPNQVCSLEGVQLNDQAKTAATVSTVTFAVGLTGVAVATYLMLRPSPAGPHPSASLAQRLRIAPELGRGQAGVAVGGVW